MKVTIQQVEKLIQSEKEAGSTQERIDALEAILQKRKEEKDILRYRKRGDSGSHTVKRTNEQGQEVVYNSTVPLSEEDISYLQKL